MRRVPVGRGESARRCQRLCQFPPARQSRSDLDVRERASQPEKSNRVRKKSQQGERRGSKPFESPRPPENRQPEASQPQRQIIVHEPHAEGIAVRQHGDAGREKPRGALRDRSNQREHAPEKNQHAKRNDDFLPRSNLPSGKLRTRREIAFMLGKILSQAQTSLQHFTLRGILLSSARGRCISRVAGRSASETTRNAPRAFETESCKMKME